jgi:hypothetical protein
VVNITFLFLSKGECKRKLLFWGENEKREKEGGEGAKKFGEKFFC